MNIIDDQGQVFAKGIVNYSSEEIRLIKGHPSKDILDILHYSNNEEVIHANNMILCQWEEQHHE